MSPALASVIMDPDEPIMLLVAAGAQDDAAPAAIQLAEERAGEGRPTILADAALTDPLLHEFLDVENLEGLADVFLFGASLSRVSTRPAGRSFQFVPGGAYVPDPGAVLDSRGWARLGTELRTAGAVMLLYIPASTPGVGALSRRVRRAVLIGGKAEAERARSRLDRDCLVLGRIEPEPAPAPAGSWPAARADDLNEPPVVRAGEKARSPVGPVLLVLLILALVAGGWFLYQAYLAPAPEPPAVQPVPPRAEAEPPAVAQPVETPLDVSVAVEAHQDLDTARQRVAALRAAEPGIDFFLAPVAVSGAVYYRLLAGPVSDAEAGTALLQHLVDQGHRTAFDSWAVRPTPYAFLLGEYDTAAEAEQRVDELAEAEIPAYIVTMRYEPGPSRFRVYGGAFETTTEAEVMAQMLDAAEVEAELIPRTGEPIA